MAAAASRSLPRLLAALRPTNRPLGTPPARTFLSPKSLQNLTQPGLEPEEEEEEAGETSFLASYLESLSFWHGESEKLREMMEMPPAYDIQVSLQEEVSELMKELANEGLASPRSGWMGSS